MLEKNELIAEVHVPAQGTKKAAYFKVTTGSADDWPALGVAAVIDGDGKAIKSARIVASAATDKATRLKSAEAVLNGKSVDDELLRQAGDAAPQSAEFIADVRGSVPYKRELMRVYVRRAVRAAAGRNGRSALMVTTLNPGTAKVGSQVGRSVPRLEGRDKVTGRAEYTHTMRLPGMLYAKLFRSTVAARQDQVGRHQRGEEASGRAARRHRRRRDEGAEKPLLRPGVPRPADPRPREGALRRRAGRGRASPPTRTSPNRRCNSSPPNTRRCPAVYDEVDALTSNVYVHEQLKPAHTFADLKHLKDAKDTNLALDYRLRRGDFDKAFAAAEHKFEHEFKTQKVLHLSFEPFACICDYKDTHVTFYDSTQGPSFVRTEIARLLGWPENKVRIKVPYLGSGYGSKLYIKLEALALALSMIARKPVKVAHTFEEMFYQITRHPSTFRIKSGVDKNGKIVARKCEVFWNGGAYADIGPRVTQKSGLTAAGPYDIDNVWINSYALYTNVTPSGALRGFGVPQLVWAYEGHTDMMARALKIDPVEFRRKNLPREGRPHATGQILKDHPVEKVMDKVLERMEWSQAVRPRRQQPHQARPRLRHRQQGGDLADHLGRHRQRRRPTARATLYCGTVDMGQGSDTAMAQMVARSPQHPDRGRAGHAARHRRDALRHGHARLALAVPHGPRGAPRRRGRARQAQGAGQGGRRAGRLQHPDRRPVPEALRHAGRQRDRLRHLQARLHRRPPPAPARARTSRRSGWCAGAGAEVEVDTETGHVKITKLINVVDCGKAINPKSVETQISGAALMHLGFTMFEKMHIDGGQVTNASLADYKIPGFHDVPAQLENIYVEHDQSNGPFGAKGVGEVATFCVGPAIANAIDDAGRRAPHGNAAQRRDGLSGVTRQSGQAAGGRVT